MILTPELLGETLRDTTHSLLEHDRKVTPQAALYAQKLGGFQCRTCAYSIPVNASHGRCAVVSMMIHLDNGCCSLWDADKKQLHLYEEPDAS